MYIHMKQQQLQKSFEKITKELEDVGKVIDALVPHAIVKKTTTFGNSSHVVLPKRFVDKRVGVVVLDDLHDSLQYNNKGGGQHATIN